MRRANTDVDYCGFTTFGFGYDFDHMDVCHVFLLCLFSLPCAKLRYVQVTKLTVGSLIGYFFVLESSYEVGQILILSLRDTSDD